MSTNNPFRAAEGDEQESSEVAEQSSEEGENNGLSPEGRRRISELEDEVGRLEERLESEERPEPEYECRGGDCDGFATEEIESEHLRTDPRRISWDRPVLVDCPRCGETAEVKEVVPKEEQKAMAGMKPLKSNNEAAGRTLKVRLREQDREGVLEEAENR
jgi:hypothetical protein